MMPANYDYIPGIQKTKFKLPCSINLNNLQGFFKSWNMETQIKKNMLIAHSYETYIYVFEDGTVQVHSFKRIRPSYLCKKIATFAG